MGAKYAPSLANLFMAKWEEDVVYTDQSPYLTFWARYINDVLLLWEGTSSQLDEFFLDLTTMIGESRSHIIQVKTKSISWTLPYLKRGKFQYNYSL